MKLSEAILLGSVGSEQGFGNLSMFANSTAKCALGAALLAVGKAPSYNDSIKTVMDSSYYAEKGINNPYFYVRDTWPWVQSYVTCPVGDTHNTVLATIYVLNDHYKWTRPQIAAWVATIEPQEEQVMEQHGGHIAEEVQSR